MMRAVLLILVLISSVLSCGCQLFVRGTRNLIVAPLNDYTVECYEYRRNRALADAAWEETAGHMLTAPVSTDYVIGFKQGYVDYLEAGGPGEPPPVPPRYYWGFRYQTPDGQAAIQDWFAGFRHGTEAALASGYRRSIVIPSSGRTGLDRPYREAAAGGVSDPAHRPMPPGAEQLPVLPREGPAPAPAPESPKASPAPGPELEPLP
jgi:hypothetical protein